jgi:hypothetical protein
MSSYDRRTFLAQAATLPLIYGIDVLSVQEPKSSEEPAWLGQAMARMKETGRWGIVLVLPASPDVRGQLRHTLWAITAFDNEDLEAHRLFCEAVFMVMTPELARKRFDQKDAVSRILLSPEGLEITSDKVDLSMVGDPVGFAASFSQFIHGDNNQRLIERARAMEKAMAPEVKDAVSKLGSESEDERLQSAIVLIRKVEGITPFLVYVAETSNIPRRRIQAKNLLTSYFGSLRPDAAGSKVPFGCTGPHHWDPCRSCGMGRVPERSRMFLRFLIPGAPAPKKEED